MRREVVRDSRRPGNDEGRFMRIVASLLAAAGFALVLAAATSAEPRNSVSSDVPIYDNAGKPDLSVDPKRFVSQMEIVDRYFDATSCELQEGSISAPGYRRILRFDTVLINSGDGDLRVVVLVARRPDEHG